MMTQTVLVTGGVGFIGSAFCRYLLARGDVRIVCVDSMTYAANPLTLDEMAGNPRFDFRRVDIRDEAALNLVFADAQPDFVFHFAAESHVDRSIDGPQAFAETNVLGTLILLQEARRHFESLPRARREAFRFVHVSTDEVYGSLGPTGSFTEETPCAPNSPYSASKAGSDHMARAWFQTYGMPTIVTRCSNNYGPYQFPEKLIPTMILAGLEEKPLPVYGDGMQVRDWLYVDDHVRALIAICERGRPGEIYNIAGTAEVPNLDVVHTLCDILDEVRPAGRPRRGLITHVTDRRGHDRRYSIDDSKLRREVSFAPQVAFADGLRRTVLWYLENGAWWEPIRAGVYQGARLGLGTLART